MAMAMAMKDTTAAGRVDSQTIRTTLVWIAQILNLDIFAMRHSKESLEAARSDVQEQETERTGENEYPMQK